MRKSFYSGVLVCVLLTLSFSCSMNSYRRVATYHDATEVLFETMTSIYSELGYEIIKQYGASVGSDPTTPFITGRNGEVLVTTTFNYKKTNTEVEILVTRTNPAIQLSDLQRIHDEFTSIFSERVYPSSSQASQSHSSIKSQPVNRTIYTGPRGGRYYINSKGKKVYIKK